MNTREITVSALCTALGVLILAFGFHVTFGEYFWYFWATLFIAFPGTKAGKACTFLATALLGFAVCGQYLYMCSYMLWLGPYALAWCLTEGVKGPAAVFARYALFAAGMLAVMWTTPMLFVRLSEVSPRTMALGAAAACAVSVPACFGYTALYRKMRDLVRERVLNAR